MSSAREFAAWSSVLVAVCGLAPACGSRSSIEPCAFGPCDEPTHDAGASGEAGTTGGSAAGGRAGRGGSGGKAGLAGSGGAAGSGAVGAAGVSGSGGAAGSGTAGNSGGLAGSAGSGGVGGDAGTSGIGGIAGAAGAPSSTAPVVILLVDASFSMFQSSVWTPLYEALMGAGGPVERYQDRVRFGFASYRGSGESSEDDPGCAEITEVPLALENTPAIRETYGSLRTRRGYFETPTGHALGRVTKSLLAEPAEARRYLILFSDGAPDTCFTTKPQCGQDRAVFAVQEAQRAGIETLAIGIGFGTEYDCNPNESRCGKDHFQDLANAGRGYPVQAPPAPYVTLPCAAETGGALLATYADRGGAAGFAWAADSGEVRSAVDSILEEIVAR